MNLMAWTEPWKYDIPTHLYDVYVWDWVLKFVKSALHSVADTGFIILGIIAVFSVVNTIINHFAHIAAINKGVSKRSLSRDIFSADIKTNLDSVVNHKVKEMEVNFLAHNRYHQKNFQLEVRDKLNSMEVNYVAQKEFNSNSSYKANADNYYKKRKGK